MNVEEQGGATIANGAKEQRSPTIANEAKTFLGSGAE